jgi:hypothetical protein
MQEQFEALQRQVQELQQRVDQLITGTNEIERRGNLGCESLLRELAGRSLRLHLIGGRTIEGILERSQQRSLRLNCAGKSLVINTSAVDMIEINHEATPAGSIQRQRSATRTRDAKQPKSKSTQSNPHQP